MTSHPSTRIWHRAANVNVEVTLAHNTKLLHFLYFPILEVTCDNSGCVGPFGEWD